MQASRAFRGKLADGTAFEQWPVLAFAEGDIMFMEKLMMVLSHSAYGACAKCSLVGEYVGGAVRCALQLESTASCDSNMCMFSSSFIATLQATA